MRAFLDPTFRREFRDAPPRDAESLPTVDSRRFAPKRLPPRVASLEEEEGAGIAGASSREVRPGMPPARTREQSDASRRAMWKSTVRQWMRQHDCASAAREWELPRADERVLLEWFDAIDVDRNGAVDAEEIRSLLGANLVGCSPARLESLFQSAGKRVDQGLSLHDFVKLMHHGGAAALFLPQFQPRRQAVPAGAPPLAGGPAALSPAKSLSGSRSLRGSRGLKKSSSLGLLGGSRVYGKPQDGKASSVGAADGGGGEGEGGGYETEGRPTLSEVRSDGDLAVMAYRRHRVLNDIRDPTKRGPFTDRESFVRKYTPGALPAYKERWSTRALEADDNDEANMLTDAETRMAADGTYFKAQIERAKEEEEAEFERLRAERRKSSLPALNLAAAPPRVRRAGTKVIAAKKLQAPAAAQMRSSMSLPVL